MSEDKHLLSLSDLEKDIQRASEASTEDEYDQEQVDYRDRVHSVDEKIVLKVMKQVNEDGTIRQHMKATKSAFVAKLVYLNGKPFDFTGRHYLKPIYNRPTRQLLLKTARQVEKTTFLGNNLTVNAVIQPYNKALYVSPSHMQTRQFSNEKLKPAIEGSPLIAQYFQDSSVSTQVFEKGFTNGSYIFLRSAFRSADRTRGISAKDLCYDKNAYVLTRLGWKSVCDLSLEDEIADVNNTGQITWSKPSRLIRKPHTGKMVTFKHAGFSLRVTDDHSMWVNFRVKDTPLSKKEDRYIFKKAIDLATNPGMGFKMTCKADWEQAPAETIEFEGRFFPYLPFCSLLGWYLAEGCISANYPVLNVSDRDLLHILPTLYALGVRFGVYPHSHSKEGPGKTVFIYSKVLGRFLKTLGKSYTKTIPRFVLERGFGVEEVLKGLYLGDACYHKGEAWDKGTLRTRSKQLAEDVQEAWLRIGRPAVVHTRMTPNKALNLTPNIPYQMTPLYEVCAYGLDYMVFWGSERSKRFEVEDVTGEEVYCFTIPFHRPIVKGSFKSKPVISGNCLDEIQDFYISEIPVIMECTSHFPDSTVLMAGTPKSLDNPIEVYWQGTTQNEWLVKCRACNHWNFLDEQNVAKTALYELRELPPGPVCKKCFKPIDVTTGQWFSFQKGKGIEGYRIPQLMVPWIVSTYDQWSKLLWKRDNYPIGQFYNEVLGISYDSASKPVTRDELVRCCDPELKMLSWIPTAHEVETYRHSVLVGGVDWGEGNDGSELSPSGKKRAASYTVFSVGYYVNQKQFKYVFIKKYMGKETDPHFIVNDIARLCKLFNIRLVGVDWGHGWGVNNHLVRLLGPDRVVQFQYLPKQKQKVKWDPIGFKYQLMRNLIISEYFYAIKNGNVVYPRWAEFQEFSKDILAVYVEREEYRREIKYDHRQTDPDDFLHSAIYCRLAGDMALGRKPGGGV